MVNQWRIQGSLPSLLLIFTPNWGPKGRKQNFWKSTPPPAPFISRSGWPLPPTPLCKGLEEGRIAQASHAFAFRCFVWSLVRAFLTYGKIRAALQSNLRQVNIGTLNVMSYFECFSVTLMLQCNLTKSDESTFFVLNVDWVFVRNWVLPYINENAKRSAASILMLYIHFPLSFPVTFGAS